jgi:hypothetical protein
MHHSRILHQWESLDDSIIMMWRFVFKGQLAWSEYTTLHLDICWLRRSDVFACLALAAHAEACP